MPKRKDQPLAKPDRRKAAQALALKLTFEGRWTHREIAEKCGVSIRAYEYWLAHPEFQARLETMRADFAATIRDTAYADKAQRIIGLSQVGEQARREFEARPWLKEERQIGRDRETGEMLVMTNEAFNDKAHAAFRGALTEIAAELGARKSVTELTAAVKVAHGLDTDDPESAAIARALIRRITGGGASDASGSRISGK